jgi:hypothetical protein
MATRPPAKRHRASATLTLIGATSLLDDYFTAATIPVAVTPASVVQNQAVNAHVRKRYPGHVGIAVPAHARVTTTEGSFSGGGAQPGKTFWCERPTGTGPLRKSNARQFTYIGTWDDLKAFARANKTGTQFILRNHSGAKITVGT